MGITKYEVNKTKRVILIFGVLVFLLMLAPLPVVARIHNRTFGQRAESPAYRAFLRYDDVESYARRVVNFPSGANMLTGYVYGEYNDKGLMVIAHSFGDGAEGYFNVIRYFVDMGWRVFAYDKTGSHNSEGRSTMGLLQSVLDLDAALIFIAAQDWGLPIVLFGHSWGGFAVTAILNFDHNIHAVVSLAGYNRPIQVLHDTARTMFGRAGSLAYPYLWVHQRILFGRDARLSAVSGVNNSDIPVMIIHGTEDALILYNSAGIIAHRYEIINPNAVFVSRDLAHHNNHMNLLMTEDASVYIDELDEMFSDLLHHYLPQHHEYSCPFLTISYLHVNALANRNISRCFCSRVYRAHLTDNVLSDFYAGIDRHRTSALDIPFMNEINAFFERALDS